MHDRQAGVSVPGVQGVLVMVHGNDKGLVLPPRVAPVQVVIIPIFYKQQQNAELPQKVVVSHYQLKQFGLRVKLDDTPHNTPGWKLSHWEQKGIPLRLEYVPQDMRNESITLVRRDTLARLTLPREEGIQGIPKLLETIYCEMYSKADLEQRTQEAKTWEEFLNHVNSKCLALTPWCERAECEEAVKWYRKQ